MLLTLYSLGTIVKNGAKDNSYGLTCEQLPIVCVLEIMFSNLDYLQCTSVPFAQFLHHTLGVRRTKQVQMEKTTPSSFKKDFLGALLTTWP